MPETLLSELARFSNFILSYAVTLAAVGAVTMALLEAWKKLRGSRPRYHQRAVLNWLRRDAVKKKKATLGIPIRLEGQYGVLDGEAGAARPYDPGGAYQELLHLTTGMPLSVSAPDDYQQRNVATALFEQELDVMMAQVQEAADAALNNPGAYPNLFGFLVSGALPRDVHRWQEALAERGDDRGLAEVHSRLRLLMKRQLDSFQTITGFRWRESNQFAATVGGAVLLFAVQAVGETKVDLLSMFATSALGGFLAPVAKDLVDALSKVKRG